MINNRSKEMIEMAKEYERRVMETRKIQEEIDQLDDQIDEIIAKMRALIDEGEDNETTRRLKILFEQSVRVAQLKGIVRK